MTAPHMTTRSDVRPPTVHDPDCSLPPMAYHQPILDLPVMGHCPDGGACAVRRPQVAQERSARVRRVSR